MGLTAPDGDDAARQVREDPLAELLLTLELVVQRDVADGGGQMRREIEERLGLAAPVHRPHQRRPAGRRRGPPPGRGTPPATIPTAPPRAGRATARTL